MDRLELARLLFHVGAWSFVVVGLGHVATELVMGKRQQEPAVMKAMREYTVKLMGRDVDLLTMHRGFSYMMGIMLIAFGAINALLVIVHPELPFETKPLLWLNIAVSAVGLFMSYKYFFLAPIALTAISTLCFSGACFLMM